MNDDAPDRGDRERPGAGSESGTEPTRTGVEPEPAPSAFVSTPVVTVPSSIEERRAPPRSWLERVAGFFTDDLPLKVLAMVLAVTTWALTRERLTTPETFTDVLVEAADPPRGFRIRGIEPELVTVTVVGTRAEIEAARAGFGRGRRIRVRLPAVDPSLPDGVTPPMSDPRAFEFPFERSELVTSISKAPTIAWTRIEERNLALGRPSLVPPRDPSIEPVAGYPQLDVQQVRVTGPARLVRTLTAIPPDPADPNTWLEENPDLAAPWSTLVGFDVWRSIGDDPLRSPALLQVDPRTVRVTVKFRQTGVRTLAHALDLSVAADSLSAMAGWDVVVTGREYDPVTLRMTLPVRSDKRTLDDMEQDPTSWSFTVRVPPPPGPGEEPIENRRVPVTLTFSPPVGAARSTAPTAALDGSPSVFVSLRRR